MDDDVPEPIHLEDEGDIEMRMGRLTDRQRRVVLRRIVENSSQAILSTFLRGLLGAPQKVVEQLVREGRVRVDGEVEENEWRVFDGDEYDPEMPITASPVVTLTFAGMKPQSVYLGCRRLTRALLSIPTRAFVGTLEGTKPSSEGVTTFLARVMSEDKHPFALAVQAAVVEMLDVHDDQNGRLGLWRTIRCRTSYHRKIVHSVANYYGLASTSLRDLAEERGWWDYGHCTCCFGPANHRHEYEGFHASALLIPVRVAIEESPVSPRPPSIATLPLRRGTHTHTHARKSTTLQNQGGGEDVAASSSSSSSSSVGAVGAVDAGWSLLEKMPDELLLEVLQLLEVPDLVNVAATSKSIRRVGLDNSLWRDLFLFYVCGDNTNAVPFVETRAKYMKADAEAPSFGQFWYDAYVEAFTTGGMNYEAGSGAHIRRNVGWSELSAEQRAARIAQAGGISPHIRCAASAIHFALPRLTSEGLQSL